MKALAFLIVIVAASYLTLGIFAPDHARSLWAPYGLLMFVLTAINLINERHRHDA